MANRNADWHVTGRVAGPVLHEAHAGLPAWPLRDRRSGHDRRRGERRFESRADSAERRTGDDRRQGHWRCAGGHHGVPPDPASG